MNDRPPSPEICCRVVFRLPSIPFLRLRDMGKKINIALSEIDVTAKPSRCTFALAQWIEERNRDVYPKMMGYQPNMSGSRSGGIGGMGAVLDIRTAVKLPDALRGEKFAFVGLPLAEFLRGGGHQQRQRRRRTPVPRGPDPARRLVRAGNRHTHPPRERPR